MKTRILSTAFLILALFCAQNLWAQDQEEAKTQRNTPAHIIVDGQGIHIKEWLYVKLRTPENFPADSLNVDVTVCVTITKEGKLISTPVGSNHPKLLAEVRKVLQDDDIHCVPQQKWNAKTKQYDALDFTTFVKIHFSYVQPYEMPEYTKKEFPKKWNRKNVYKVYRGNLLRPSFHQGKDLKESVEKFRAWVAAKVVYPEALIEQGVEGEFKMSFFVDKDLKLQIAEVDKSPHALITQEVVRVIETSPIWQPTLRWNFVSEQYDFIRSRFSITLDFKNPINN
ncbi:MAG: hypothetical protein R3Y38_03815 [Rikenellaceae bacterium]